MPLSVIDRLEILELAARYNLAVDTGDSEGVATLFTEDGLIDATASGQIKGHTAIARYIATRPKGWERRRHFNSNPLIRGDGDNATLTLYLLVLGRRETVTPRLVGRYEDQLRRVDGEWRFVQRRIIVDADAQTGNRNED